MRSERSGRPNSEGDGNDGRDRLSDPAAGGSDCRPVREDAGPLPGELYPRVGFVVTNLGRPAERVVAFYNRRGTAEQWIKEGKNAIRWTRLSCRRFDHNAVRLQLHALAYNLGNFMRTLALPDAVEQWSLTSLREKLIKIGAKIVRHGRLRHVPDGRGCHSS